MQPLPWLLSFAVACDDDCTDGPLAVLLPHLATAVPAGRDIADTAAAGIAATALLLGARASQAARIAAATKDAVSHAAVESDG